MNVYCIYDPDYFPDYEQGSYYRTLKAAREDAAEMKKRGVGGSITKITLGAINKDHVISLLNHRGFAITQEEVYSWEGKVIDEEEA